MQAKAQLRFLRMSPKKVRLIANLIRGLKVEEAVSQLTFMNKAAQRPVLKLLKSAIANAENNFQLKKDNLFIKEIKVDMAGALKRWQPRAHGRATPIRKKLSHILIVLDEIRPTKTKVAKKAQKQEKLVKLSSKEEIKEVIKPAKIAEKTKLEKIGKEHTKEIDKEIEDVRLEGKHRHNQNADKRTMKQGKGFITKIFNRKSG
jgi:large subunit ribosomal protein L22